MVKCWNIGPQLCEPLSKDEIQETLKKISSRKVEGPDQILVEVWKYLGEEGLMWLTKLMNVIFSTIRCLENGRSIQLLRCTRTKVTLWSFGNGWV